MTETGLELELDGAYCFEATLAYLAAREAPSMERVTSVSYRKALTVGSEVAEVAFVFRRTGNATLLTVTVAAEDTVSDPPCIAQAARSLFDFAAPFETIAAHLRRDSRLRGLVDARPGLGIPGTADPFELAVRAVAGQQVSVRAAARVTDAIATAFGRPATAWGEEPPLRRFPHPADLVEADLAGLGLPRQRVEAIRQIAEAQATGELQLGAADHARLRDHLLEIRGVGPWTAEYIALRAGRDPDSLPTSDLGLRAALGHGATPLTAKELERHAERWRPWRSYAAMHLWTTFLSC